MVDNGGKIGGQFRLEGQRIAQGLLGMLRRERFRPPIVDDCEPVAVAGDARMLSHELFQQGGGLAKCRLPFQGLAPPARTKRD